MGHRMELYVDEQYAQEIISISESFGIPAQIVGRVQEGAKQLEIHHEGEIYRY